MLMQSMRIDCMEALVRPVIRRLSRACMDSSCPFPCKTSNRQGGQVVRRSADAAVGLGHDMTAGGDLQLSTCSFCCGEKLGTNRIWSKTPS